MTFNRHKIYIFKRRPHCKYPWIRWHQIRPTLRPKTCDCQVVRLLLVWVFVLCIRLALIVDNFQKSFICSHHVIYFNSFLRVIIFFVKFVRLRRVLCLLFFDDVIVDLLISPVFLVTIWVNSGFTLLSIDIAADGIFFVFSVVYPYLLFVVRGIIIMAKKSLPAASWSLLPM